MPRQVRIEYAGATYHVMCRGNRREAIYGDDDDRRMYLATLAEAVGKTGWRALAYVLRGNHYHPVLKPPEPKPVRTDKTCSEPAAAYCKAGRRGRKKGGAFQRGRA